MKIDKYLDLPRYLDDLAPLVQPNRVLVIYGPRRVGKTTIVQNYLKTTPYSYKFVVGDDISVHEYLSSQSLEKLKAFVGEAKLIVIDEAQLVPNIGMNLKLLVDNFPDIRVIVTGSASFDLAQQIGEPLV